MPVEVTARHMDASDTLLEYAREKGERILAEFPRVEHVHVILDVEKKRKIAEMVIQAKNHVRLESAEESMNMKMSIDGVYDNIATKLQRLREKVQEHRVSQKRVEAIRIAGDEV